jgi:hypothetical protein
MSSSVGAVLWRGGAAWQLQRLVIGYSSAGAVTCHSELWQLIVRMRALVGTVLHP